MTQNSKIYAPNVYLFAYHLCKPLESESISPEEFAKLWEKCHEILQAKLAFGTAFNGSYLSKKDEPAGWRVNLINKQVVGNRNSLPFAKNISLDNQQISLKGFAQPLRIDDCYALGLQIRIPEKVNNLKTPAVDVSIFKEFNPDNCLLPDFVQSYFGQTLLLTAWLSVEQNQAAREDALFLKKLAQQCLEKFISGDNQPSFYRQGELFGSPILEYGHPSRQDTECHIIVWFFNSSATDEIWDETRYSDFVELFLYRNKILRAYHDTRKTYLVTREEYKHIELNIDATFKYLQRDKAQQRQLKGAGLKQEELEHLERQTIEMPPRAVNYARLLMDLEFRQNTIAINAKNYENKLYQISLDLKSRKKYNDSECDLSFLELFSKETSPQFQEQIKADLGYFTHGTGLLDKAMEAIRGVVAIEEAYRDAKLEVTIQAVGFGLGVAGVVAGSSPYLIKQDPPNQVIALPFLKVGINSFALVLLISIGAGVVVWSLVMLGANSKNLLGKLKNLLGKNKQLPPQ
ncbi:hypothetical protein K4039_15775 [Lyngbya sp. CCAP 1446/10]|uniref:hypothetical protein n=1 Tax=Lyngbya sp. CCAP 1446/10 TaxID=439293 RepID=UPI002238CD61|nr:hypothetical protein [Lyngbya sp. CCAP 1446/10]MCW6051506.1 hypothetical protein [Lyngbya sp. CCAP 1446/10]